MENRIKRLVRDVVDFPSEGIVFRDITPILKDQELCSDIIAEFVSRLKGINIDVVAGIESRGFLFGMMLANELKVPFVPIRKEGKLPYKSIKQCYDLEYGQSVIEIHEDAFKKGSNILVHDDLLATGGTVYAASELIGKLGGKIAAYSFLIGLEFLKGEDLLKEFGAKVVLLTKY
ncbi:adenine phosphoribosyltransferase [Pseudopedobacter beijingensis]|uniref:Adenine phosphoribosyltransferase n=2 Tax=Pseudopedobacter beijingensis TaxID=1207056 RepID=A0ABW4IGC0_9SPHI